MKLNLDFWRGGVGVKEKTILEGGMDIFWNHTLCPKNKAILPSVRHNPALQKSIDNEQSYF